MAARKDSIFTPLIPLQVGGYHWAQPADAQRYASRITAASRYPRELQGRRFTTGRGVAVMLADGQALQLVKVTRIK